jgi:hypothetical protein
MFNSRDVDCRAGEQRAGEHRDHFNELRRHDALLRFDRRDVRCTVPDNRARLVIG